MRTPVITAAAPPQAGPYSQGIRVGDLLFVAGQGPFDTSGARVGTTIEEQLHATFANLAAIAAAAGTGLEHMVRLGAFLRDLDDFPALNAVAGEVLTEPYPVRTTIPCSLRGFDVELDAVFWVPPAG